MNWYKRAQQQQEEEWKWKQFLKGFGILTVMGVAGLLGLDMLSLRDKYSKNPQEIEQRAEEYQKTEQIQFDPNLIEPKVEPLSSGTVSQENLDKHFKGEYEIILAAAKRNNLDYEDYDLLFAIRKAENGSPRREFGIIHPKCEAEMDKRPTETLDIQAGWAAATIVKNRARWEKEGKPGDFITYLGQKYAPKGVTNDPNNLNKNWIDNVSKWENDI